MPNEIPLAPVPSSSDAKPSPARSSPPIRPAPFPNPARDSVTTIRSDGSRTFLFPADAYGRFTRARQISAFGLIAFYLSLPWIKINGYPAVFLDVAERRFHLFGITLAAQDLWLLFFVITGLGFSLFFVTALLGRVWCGWACPQTIFLDHVYRRIERWIDGDAVQRRALQNAPLSAGKFFKRALKHTLYLLVSAAITHLFLAYFVSLPEVWAMMRAAPVEHWGAFGFIAVATGILYFNFAWFREQLCIVICPYGRIQSALIDDHSLVVGYDTTRGEPRGPRSKSNLLGYSSNESAVAAGKGDCIDCHRCVQVCPTGIDIRQGLQMECIGCTACIDACDDVMTRLDRPRGLIRYDSQKAFAGGRTRWLRPRTFLYGALLAIGASVAAWALSTVRPANFGVTRMTGAPYIVDDTTVRNQFLVRIVNKRNEPARFTVQLREAPANVRQIGFDTTVEVGPLAELVQPFVLQQPRDAYNGPFHFKVRVEDAAGKFHLEREVEFLGPEARLLREEEEKK
ncbi:MAG: cytochrome c oxidase accessory protein CcoG [Opitutaceae bacterium]